MCAHSYLMTLPLQKRPTISLISMFSPSSDADAEPSLWAPGRRAIREKVQVVVERKQEIGSG